MYILGLSALEHDSAAALLSERGIEAAIEESKLVRVPGAGGIPRAAIRFCFERAGISWRDVAVVAVASRPWHAWRRELWMRARSSLLAPMASGYAQTKALGVLGRELNNFRILETMCFPAGRLEGTGPRVQGLEHHLCHAASAFYASPFDRALILTLDENGDGWSGLIAVGEGNRIRPLRAIRFPHSIGWLYSQVTALVGFEPHSGENKLQWLSLEGQPVFEDVFRNILLLSDSGSISLDKTYFNNASVGRVAFSEKFYRELGFESEERFRPSPDLRRQLARSLEQALASVIVEWIERLQREADGKNVCLAGGVFLNNLLVAAIEKSFGFNKVFVQPVAGNSGSALGAAWLIWHEVLHKPRAAPLTHLQLGPRYSAEEIKSVLDNCKARYRWFDTDSQRVEAAVRTLEEGEILAWYQGPTEFGLRALGNRSLLASPWAAYVKENLNHYVKHREPFRPFALAVPEEDCSRYFDCSPQVRFMATVGWVRPEARDLVGDFVLPGDRIRLSTINRESHPLLWQVLKEFGKRAPAPFLINASFNLFGEPLVVTPRDAVRSFFCSGIDAMAMDGFFVSKF